MAAMPSTLYYTMFELPIGTLYFSTLLANLNARRYVLGDGGIWMTNTVAHTRTTATTSHDTVDGAVRMVPMDTGRPRNMNGSQGQGRDGGQGRLGVLTHVRPCFAVHASRRPNWAERQS